MNFVDLFVILLMISTVIRGAQVGSVRQLLSTSGFFVGLVFGAWIEPRLIGLTTTPLSRTILALGVTLGFALVFMGIGEYLGVVFKHKLAKHRVNIIDSVMGVVVGLVTLFLTVWLAAAVLITLPFPGLQADLKSSFFVSNLSQRLPATPNIIADLSHLIDPNGFPHVFNGQEPTPGSAKLPDIGQLQSAVTKDASSVFKIEGRGCGGIVEGTGFVIAPGLIATNAHVVAGVARPFVLDQSGQHALQAIWFDPNLDFAVLKVEHLNATPLSLTSVMVAKNTPAVVMGYPGGGDFSAQPAVVLDEFTAAGRNIYNQGVTERDIYEIKANVIPGNSGGPLVQADGSVIGIVFAESTTYNNTGYALTMPKVVSEIQQAEAKNQPTTTGTCAQ